MIQSRLQSIPGAARAALAGTVTGSISSAGTTQATATAVVDDINVVSTAAAGSGVIVRSDLSPGDWQVVTNSTSNVLFVYPPVGGALNIGGLLAKTANQPLSLAPGRTAQILCLTNPHAAATFAVFLSA